MMIVVFVYALGIMMLLAYRDGFPWRAKFTPRFFGTLSREERTGRKLHRFAPGEIVRLLRFNENILNKISNEGNLDQY